MAISIVRPRIAEIPGVPEFYSDGWTIRDCGEVVRIILYVETAHGADQNLLVVTKRTGFHRSLIAAAGEFLPAMGGDPLH